MIGWVRGRTDAWQRRSRHAQVEASTRWTLVALPWFFLAGGVVPLPVAAADTPTATPLAWAVLGTSVALCTTSSVVVCRALSAYLGERGAPWAAMAVLAAQAVAASALTVWLVVADGSHGQAAEGMALMFCVSAPLMPYSLLVRTGVVTWTLGGIVAAVAVVFTSVGVAGGDVAAVAVVTLLGGLGMALSTRCSGWYIAVMRELDEAREAQSRLAVAEERLRFGRDLHDVLGRNLSVIALKSELAVQLARRGGRGPEASLDQMVEVQRIARDSQREVREVVRGYREADLVTELAGARGVLRAAGIDCRTEGDGGALLPEPVRAALGWVVREGTTNVLRHAAATHCAISVRTVGGTALLTMENDGAAGTDARTAGTAGSGSSGGGGAGLTGLRERLAALGGTLCTDRPASATFRLTAEIPLPGPAAGAGSAGGTDSAHRRADRTAGAAPPRTPEVGAAEVGAPPPPRPLGAPAGGPARGRKAAR